MVCGTEPDGKLGVLRAWTVPNRREAEVAEEYIRPVTARNGTRLIVAPVLDYDSGLDVVDHVAALQRIAGDYY